MQWRLIVIGTLGTIVQTIRCPDVAAVFGRMSVSANRLLYAQLGCLGLEALVLVMLATARSLYMQMQRSVPRIFPIAFYSIIIINHTLSIPIIVGNIISTDADDQDMLMNW